MKIVKSLAVIQVGPFNFLPNVLSFLWHLCQGLSARCDVLANNVFFALQLEKFILE